MSQATPSSVNRPSSAGLSAGADPRHRRVRFLRPRLEGGDGRVERHALSPAEIDAGRGVKSVLSLASLTSEGLAGPPALALRGAGGDLRLEPASFRQEATEIGILSVAVYPASPGLLRRLARGGTSVRLEISGRLQPVAFGARDRRRFEEFLTGGA